MNAPITLFNAIYHLPFTFLIKLPRDIESDVPVAARAVAARDLAERHRPVVREVDLERVAAPAALDGERGVVIAGVGAAQPGRELADEIHRRRHAHARAKTQDERAVGCRGRLGQRLQDEERLHVGGAALAEAPRQVRAERARVVFGEIVEALHGGDRIEPERTALALLHDRELPEKLNRAIARAQQRELPARPEPVSHLESDDRAAVESEEV